MKIGRNAPCPCGSGKKYKKCCMRKGTPPSLALYYRRLSEAHDRLVNRLITHATRVFGKEGVGVAMDEFLLWPDPEDEIPEEIIERIGAIFWPWFLFNWEYDAREAGVELPGPEGRTVAELYAEARAGKLNTLEQHLIESVNRTPYSFWEALSVDRGEGMALRDILTGSRIDVLERSGSENVEPGDLLFGRAVAVDGVGMLMGLGVTLIPPAIKLQVIELRKRMSQNGSAVTEDTLYDWDTEIRELYFQIDRSLHTAPEIRNSDGHRLELHRLVYEVPSAQEAFGKLSDLCVTMTPGELGADAARDENGRIVRVEIPWERKGGKISPGMAATLLGRIVIDGRRLTAEVNSAERAETLRREIDARLRDSGRFRVDDIQDIDAMMSRHSNAGGESGTPKNHEALMQQPEIQEHLGEIISRHWETWVDESIPALGGSTPRDAVKTADGREAVEALLQDAERPRGQDPFMLEANRKGAARVRALLGLPPR